MIFRFADPAAMVFLLVIPVVAAKWIFGHKADLSLGFPVLEKLAKIPGAVSIRPILIPRILRVMALILIIIAAARPQSGDEKEVIYSEGVDIIVALDISGSMRALDFQPENRLEVSKKVIRDFIHGRINDRIGLVLFGSDAFTLCPLTLDHDLLLDFLDQAKIGMVEEQTALGKAVSSAVNRLRVTSEKRKKSSPQQKPDKKTLDSRIVILVTDGVNNVQSGLDPITAATAAESLGIRIYTIGVGTNGIAPFPHPRFKGRITQSPVELDEDTLKQIASITGGQYFPARNSKALQTIFDVIDSLEKTKIESYKYTRYSELFYWPLLVGLFLLLLELTLKHTVYRRFPC
ncbi:VWA domain-containing protein [bacterium]|nr:VWA domain-containing protein [bacterium]